jgi:hypothetical protein
VTGCLRDVFASVPDEFGYMKVPRHDFVPAVPGDGPFHQRMVVRRRSSTHLSGSTLLPKIAQRPAAGDCVDHGNHNLVPPRLPLAPDLGMVEILHFQTRSFEQYERKVLKLGLGVEAVSDPPSGGLGSEARELLAMHRRHELRAYYDGRVGDPDGLTDAVERGDLEFDHRLRRFLAVPAERVHESRAVQAWLTELWSRYAELQAIREDASNLRARCAELDARRAELQDRCTDLETALEATRRVEEQRRDELESTRSELESAQTLLATIRASAVMRYTAPARLAYYRLRPRGR